MNQDRINSATRNFSNPPTNAGVGLHSKRIQAGLSSQIVIQVQDDANGDTFVIGAVQSMSVTEDRTITPIYEVGTDKIIQLVPTSATTYSIELNRIVFDFQRLPDALQREYRHIHAQRRPFDIVVTDYNPYLQNQNGPQNAQGDQNLPGSGSQASEVFTKSPPAIHTTYGNCWFTRLNFTYTQNEYLITETCSLSCEFVMDSAAPNTIKGSTDEIERQAGISQTASVMSAFDASNL